MGKLLVVLGLMLVSLAIVLCGCTTNEIQQKTDDTSKITGTWEAADQTGATGTLIYKFYSNGNYKWYDTENLGGWNFEGTWNWTDGQIVVYQTYPVEQTRYIDYYFTDNDQTLTITLGNEGSMTLTKLQEETDDTSKITGNWSGETPKAPTWIGIFEFYTNGSYHWYDPDDLSGWNFEGTWSWSEGQIANVQTYPADKTSSWDYYFTDNDQTLTITLGNEGTYTLSKI